MWLVGIGALHDQFSRGAAVNGKVQLVLNFGKKSLSGRRIAVVVHRRGVDVRHLLVKLSLRESDLAYLGQQLLKVVHIQKATVLQTLLVEHKALDGEFTQHACGPLAKLGGPHRVDPIAH
ncbi:hypothetical protein D9M69_646740 [compost metagenome]